MATVWISITTDSVSQKLTDPEISAVDTYHTSPGQPSPLTETVDGVVKEVRGYIQACAKNTLNDDDDTIPDSLEETALILVRHRLSSRLPDCGILVTDDRQREYEEALQRLRDVASCRFGNFKGGSGDCAVSSSDTDGVVHSSNKRACSGGSCLVKF